MENDAITVMTPMLQYGFAFFSLVLVVILFFVIKWLLAEVKASRLAREGLLDQTKLVVENNTQAVRSLEERMRQYSELLGDLRDKLLARPCMRE